MTLSSTHKYWVLYNSAVVTTVKRKLVFLQSATCCTETKECSFVCDLIQTHSLAKQIVMADKWLWSLSVSVTVATKQCTRSDGINQLSNNEYGTLQVCVCLCSRYCCPTRNAHVFCAASYCHLWPLRLYLISPHLTNVTILKKRIFAHKMCLYLLYNFCPEYF